MTIGWTPRYRYLGYHIQWDLDEEHMATAALAAITAASHRLYHCAPVVRSLTTPVQLQLVRSYVVGTVQYLSGVMSYNRATWDKLNVPLRTLLRDVLFMSGKSSPNALVDAASGFVPLHVMAAGQYQRLLLTIHTLPAVHPDALVTRVIRAIHGTTAPATRRSRLLAWSRTFDIMKRELQLTGDLSDDIPDATAPHNIPRFVQPRVRDMAHRQWLTALRVPAAGTGMTTASRPTSVPPRAALHDTLALGATADMDVSAPPPLSQLGPGGSRPLVVLAQLPPRLLAAVIKLPLGRLALFLSPCSPPHMKGARGAGGAPAEPGNLSAHDRAAIGRTAWPCLLCRGARSTYDDPWHLINECENATVLAARAVVRRSAPAIVTAILAEVEAAHRRTGVPAALQAALAVARSALSATNGTGGDCEFVLFRLLAVLPFPAAAAAPAHPLAAALGRVFDNTRLHHQHLGRLATRWVRWASRGLRILVTARTTAYIACTRAWRASQAVLVDHANGGVAGGSLHNSSILSDTASTGSYATSD